ncbi:MAG: hypothetical protein SFV23_06215 [Planctomycetaceae bacterium]|nr:hypothetical protein [Planctomycetaceae bacterium]
MARYAIRCLVFILIYCSSDIASAQIVRSHNSWSLIRGVAGTPVDPAAHVEIPEEPTSLFIGRHLPQALNELVTVDFQRTPLNKVVEWLRTERKMTVVFDEVALSDEAIAVDLPMSVKLDNAPLYELLDRLQLESLAWFWDDGLLWVTTQSLHDERMPARLYNLADLIGQGYDAHQIAEAITSCTSDNWGTAEGVGGSIAVVGRILCVRTTGRTHLEVESLLAALRSPARRIVLLDAPEHPAIRKKLMQPVKAEFQGASIREAVQSLARQAEITVEFDTAAINDEGISLEFPVTASLDGQPLQRVLETLLEGCGLRHSLSYGVLWISTQANLDEYRMHEISVFDVRDFCRTSEESQELAALLQEMTSGPWDDSSGTGGDVTFARPGVVVVRNSERVLDDVDQLLESFRKLHRESPPPDPEQEMLTRAYRVPSAAAHELAELLPDLVERHSWEVDASIRHPAGIRIVPTDGVAKPPTSVGTPIEASAAPAGALTETRTENQSILVIRQTRAAHRDISEWLHRLQTGDPPLTGPATNSRIAPPQ